MHLPFVHQRLCKIILQNQRWFWWSACSETKAGSIFMALLFTAPTVKLTKKIFCQCAIIFHSTQNRQMTFMIGGTSQEAWLIWLGPSLPSIYQIGRSYYSRTIWHQGNKTKKWHPENSETDNLSKNMSVNVLMWQYGIFLSISRVWVRLWYESVPCWDLFFT